MSHQKVKEQFIEALYGELHPEQEAAFRRHLDSCPECKGEYDEMAGVAETMSMRKRQELSKEDWKAFWNVLEANVEAYRSQPQQRSSGWSSFIGRISPAVRFGLAAAVILLAGIGIGRFGLLPWESGSPGSPDTEQVQAQRAALREETMQYLERSKILLLGIVNTEEIVPESGQLDRQQELSRRLVSQGGPLKERLNRSGQQELHELVNDLEVLLLQIANLEIENDFPGLEIIRGGVDRKGILLKINVEQMKTQKQRSVRPPQHDDMTSRSMI